VEEDERDAEREEELHADRVERDVEPVERLGAEEHTSPQQDHHARHAEKLGDELGDDARSEEDRQRLDDVARRHGRDSDLRRGRLRRGPP
jgi:hypothetical protein